MSFKFETVRHIESYPGTVNNLGELARRIPCRRVLIVTDRGIEESGLLKRPLLSLRKEMDQVTVFYEVQADPPEAVILAAVAQARDERIDGVVGIGGGSSLDTANLAALLARCSP